MPGGFAQRRECVLIPFERHQGEAQLEPCLAQARDPDRWRAARRWRPFRPHRAAGGRARDWRKRRDEPGSISVARVISGITSRA